MIQFNLFLFGLKKEPSLHIFQLQLIERIECTTCAQKWMDSIKNNPTQCKTDAAANRNEFTPNRWEIICAT